MSMLKQIEQSDWQDRLQTFTSGNKGSTFAIAAEGMTLVENKPQLSINCDPAGTGNVLLSTVEEFSHTVSAPVELFISTASSGVVYTLELIGQNGKSTFPGLINKVTV